VAAGIVLCAGCAGGIELNLFYKDELVEAPTRHVDIVALRGSSCAEALSRSHDTNAGLAVARRALRYPVSPDEDPFDGFPEETLTLDVVGLDHGLLQLSRACREVDLGAGGRLDLELRTLPECPTPPTALELSIVLDTSVGMQVADPDRNHITALRDFIVHEGFPAASWSLVSFGHDDTATEQVISSTIGPVLAALGRLERAHRGRTRLYDGMVLSASLARARALCGRRAAMLLIVGSHDDGSKHRFEEAALGLYATQGDAKDDLFTFGLGLSESAFEDLGAVIPDGVGRRTAARGVLPIRNAMSEAGLVLRELL